ncbi:MULTISPECIES: lytic transglycosylase domain-containing protein [Streptomycetaceae]|uniref:Putative secreted transglycosylase n=1 Tax=Streptantibioticus cattleyicolor (strain ATCC 35852 / DSM 46488 / JCM 4925 / NBRC 14057 / NRRL 8057) TaxID=1003195 RepID=F8K046_STREN|nr:MULTISPECIES: lytic transglycosylase domain-containing protein [Streptomycetaceae]AEW94822.1 putative secreted transglycosylase [Streptantibioticus cattleyicolor NRRL 8057 = DSM 46488]MYS59444.1 transglycosylase SLT domain-containing protein [Streptomyces sp. SID5468]CCB75179.1 exported protein of unknown function [Streptantibioticus cattleyicolor NRRL 8057 = DSM 46488]
MDTEPDHSGRKRRGCLVRAVVAAVVVIAAALGVTWLLTRPPALPVIPAQYLPTIRSAAARCPEISVPLLAAQIDAESHWNPQADSGKAQGIAQFDPDTWAEWGRDHDGDGKADVWDPKDAIPSQADYMCELYKEVRHIPGDPTQLALAAYNAGPNAVFQANGIPQIDETVTYVQRIEKLVPQYAQTYAKQIGASASPSASR